MPFILSVISYLLSSFFIHELKNKNRVASFGECMVEDGKVAKMSSSVRTEEPKQNVISLITYLRQTCIKNAFTIYQTCRGGPWVRTRRARVRTQKFERHR